MPTLDTLTPSPSSTVSSRTPRPGDRAGPLRLTARELEVLGLVTDDYSDAEIAEVLGLSLRVVKGHLRSAYRTIGVPRRREAASWGLSHLGRGSTRG